MVIGATICTLLAAGGIAGAVFLLPRIFDNISQQIADANRREFKGYTFEIPSDFRSGAGEQRGGDMMFEGKAIGTGFLRPHYGPEFEVILFSYYEWDPTATISDPIVQSLLTTSDPMITLKSAHHTDPLDVSYQFKNEKVVTINGLEFAVADYVGRLEGVPVEGRMYVHRNANIQLEIGFVGKPGFDETGYALLDKLCATIQVK
ncbi:MAG: hypothetical protein ABJZ55_05050 [Fuerstiella sp.]